MLSNNNNINNITANTIELTEASSNASEVEAALSKENFTILQNSIFENPYNLMDMLKDLSEPVLTALLTKKNTEKDKYLMELLPDSDFKIMIISEASPAALDHMLMYQHLTPRQLFAIYLKIENPVVIESALFKIKHTLKNKNSAELIYANLVISDVIASRLSEDNKLELLKTISQHNLIKLSIVHSRHKTYGLLIDSISKGFIEIAKYLLTEPLKLGGLLIHDVVTKRFTYEIKFDLLSLIFLKENRTGLYPIIKKELGHRFADFVLSQDEGGRCALHYAFGFKHNLEYAKDMLFSLNASQMLKALHSPSNERVNLLHLFNDTECFKQLLKLVGIEEFNKALSMKAKGFEQHLTPLEAHVNAGQGHFVAIQFILKHMQTNKVEFPSRESKEFIFHNFLKTESSSNLRLFSNLIGKEALFNSLNNICSKYKAKRLSFHYSSFLTLLDLHFTDFKAWWRDHETRLSVKDNPLKVFGIFIKDKFFFAENATPTERLKIFETAILNYKTYSAGVGIIDFHMPDIQDASILDQLKVLKYRFLVLQGEKLKAYEVINSLSNETALPPQERIDIINLYYEIILARTNSDSSNLSSEILPEINNLLTAVEKLINQNYLPKNTRDDATREFNKKISIIYNMILAKKSDLELNQDLHKRDNARFIAEQELEIFKKKTNEGYATNFKTLFTRINNQKDHLGRFVGTDRVVYALQCEVYSKLLIIKPQDEKVSVLDVAMQSLISLNKIKKDIKLIELLQNLKKDIQILATLENQSSHLEEKQTGLVYNSLSR